MNYRFEIDTVMKYFYEISKIPRKSGKEEKIADYIENFAKENNFKYKRDKNNNIIIIKEATNSSSGSLLLQCHMDMVCEKEKNSNHNFDKDPIEVYVDGDFIKAKGTTLGADNGIGVAIILAILSANNLKYPRIEAIFTVQEETTMLGAKTIELSNLKGKRMICLDNMRENELLIGCAGARIFECKILGDQIKINEEYKLIKLEMDGFVGGHSGNDIAKGRGNPIKEMGNLLSILLNNYNIYLKDITGGEKVNVIPRECCVELYVKSAEISLIQTEIEKFEKSLKNKNYESVNIVFTLENIEDENSFDEKTTKKIIDIINSIPNGVYYQSEYKSPLVSLNIGKIETSDNYINLMFSIRSNREEIENKLIEELNSIIEKYSIITNVSQLSGYEHKEKSDFIDKCKEIYINCLGKTPKMVDMHICLEAGLFGEKIPNLDFIAVAPDIFDAHSPKERCSISSLKRIYNYILTILENL